MSSAFKTNTMGGLQCNKSLKIKAFQIGTDNLGLPMRQIGKVNPAGTAFIL